MLGRTPVAVMALTVAAVAFAPASASAQGREETADQAQALSEFPVYTVTRAAGLPAYYSTEVLEDHPFCEDEVVRGVHVELRRGKLLRFGRRWIAMRQTDERCAVGTVGKPVRRVRLFGKRVMVRRHCLGRQVTSCKGMPVSRRVHTAVFSIRAGAERTWLAVSASNMSVRAFVRAMRSLRAVDLTRPVVQLTSFLGADGNAWCGVPGPGAVSDDLAFCVWRDPFRHGMVSEDGSVDLCNQAPCLPNFDVDAPQLTAGQVSEGPGFRCEVQAAAVTCTITGGEHAGKGFTIDASGAVEVTAPG
jgi:hypothetical protein